MNDDSKLFASFPPVKPEEWIQQAIKDLKGAAFETLEYTTAEGITVKPFYTAEDIAALPECRPLFMHTDWDICEVIYVTDEDEANKKALHALDNGATALHFRLTHQTDMPTLLREIGAPYISLQFSINGDPLIFWNNMRAYILSQGWQPEQLNISVHADFIAQALQQGSANNTYQKDLETWTKLFTQSTPYKTLCVDAALYHDAGAPPAYQLACALAHAHTYINACTEAGIPPASLDGRIQVTLAAGTDYFFEIAKFRALRKVFALLLETYGIKNQLYVHAVTADRPLTIYDAYNNLLRTTTAAMAAVTGGCNTLSVTPFDSTFTTDNEFSRRIARNIQLILKHESHFDKIADSAAGSYFIEMLTEQIAEKAWNGFQQIEAAGGFPECLRAGSVQETISSFAAKEQEDFAAGKIILVGANKYPDLSEQMQEKISIPPAPETDKNGAYDIQPLAAIRLSAHHEQARLVEENKKHEKGFQ